MPPSLPIDFSSVIENARFFAARAAALRPPAGRDRAKAGRWGARPGSRRHPSSTAGSKPAPASHAP